MKTNKFYVKFFLVFLNLIGFSCHNSHSKKYSYYDNGKIKFETEIKNGISDGMLTAYYKNGNKWFELFFKDDKPQGNSISWYENGQKHIETYAIDGKTAGKYKKWFKNGQIEFDGFYMNGFRTGKWQTYFENGNKRSEGFYFLGNKIAKWSFWNQDGTLKDKKTYLINSKETQLTKITNVNNFDINEPLVEIYKIEFFSKQFDTTISVYKNTLFPLTINSLSEFVNINIYYKIISNKSKEDILLKTRLLGFENIWSSTKSEEKTKYEKIPKGNFTFEIIACSNSGIWNIEPIKYSFVIK